MSAFVFHVFFPYLQIIIIITARIRRMGEGNVFSLFTPGGVRVKGQSRWGGRSKVNPAGGGGWGVRSKVNPASQGGVRSKVNPAGGGGWGVRSKVNPASQGGSGQRSIQPGGGGGVRSSQGGSGQRSIQLGGLGPAGGGVGCQVQLGGGGSGQRSIQPGESKVNPAGGGQVQPPGGGQHLAPSCGRYASCIHAGGLSCFPKFFTYEHTCWLLISTISWHIYFTFLSIFLKLKRKCFPKTISNEH